MNIKHSTIPRRDSLAARVINFFKFNPEERLSVDDICIKFDANRASVHTLLARTIAQHELVRERDELGEYVYIAGPALAMQSAKPVPMIATTNGASRNGVRYDLDIDALQVEDGIPFDPSARVIPSKWDPLFDKLTTPGQSVAVPLSVKAALAAAAHKRNKEQRGEYRVMITGPEQARVWRVA